jgi:proteasome lid subunit RPN8/RPN11
MIDIPTRSDQDLRPTPAIGVDATAEGGAARAASRLRLPSELRRQLTHLAEISYPYEACGVLLGLAAGRLVAVERVLHARNLHFERPRDRYLLDPDDFLAADRVARAAGLEIVGIWHSHPDGPPRPSRTDLETAWEGYSYLIVSIAAIGSCELRSWRLADGRFLEEGIVD